MGIGGKAEYFAEPVDRRALSALLKQAKKNKIKTRIIGSGSNILVSSGGVCGLVVRLNSPSFRRMRFSGNSVICSSGVKLSRLLSASCRRGMSGAEFLSGIPGTVGGALAMNAGIPGKSIADILCSVTVMDYSGEITVLNRDDISCGYRDSSLLGFVIIEAVFRLKRSSVSAVKGRMKHYLDYRRQRQDTRWGSAGCFFRNPQDNLAAGKLIDLCGLKGLSRGGAQVSPKHANFIINKGGAVFADVIWLANKVSSTVKKKFGVKLVPEVKVWK